MKNYFYKIHGEPVEELNYSINWIGDLMYYEWPLVSVVKVKGFEYPFIKAWVDATNTKERHLLFGITTKMLEGYLIKQEPYSELFRNAIDDHYIAIDTDLKSGQDISVTACCLSDLNKKYLPKSAVLLDYYDEEEVSRIASAFSLSLDTDKYLYGESSLLERAREKGTDLINIHLTSHNDSVGHGTIKTDTLGNALLFYSKMAEAAAINIHTEKKEKFNTLEKWRDGERNNVLSFAQTRFYAQAASFDIFLQPIRQVDPKEKINPVEDITQRVFELFRIGEDVDLDSEIRSGLSDELIYAYENFLKLITNSGMRAAMQYGNPLKEYVIQHSIDGYKADKILNKLKTINISNKVERKLTGRFTAFDITKKTFSFLTVNNHHISGSIEKEMAEGINSKVNFKSSFIISLITHYQRRSSKGLEVEKNNLISCLRVKDK